MSPESSPYTTPDCGSKAGWIGPNGVWINVACTLAPHSGNAHKARIDGAARGLPLCPVEVTVTWTRPLGNEHSKIHSDGPDPLCSVCQNEQSQ